MTPRKSALSSTTSTRGRDEVAPQVHRRSTRSPSRRPRPAGSTEPSGTVPPPTPLPPRCPGADPGPRGGQLGTVFAGVTREIIGERRGAVDTADAGSDARSVQYEPVAQRPGDEVSARAGADLRHRVADVRPHRVVGDLQLVGDLRAAPAQRDQPDDLTLSGRE